MQPFDPAKAIPGTVLQGIDPSTLLSNRDELEEWRLDIQRQLISAGVKRHTMIQVNTEGVIISGNHGARAAAERGMAIDVQVLDIPHPHCGPILSIPIVHR
jgi:phenylacetate-coenzyme A ligase PaaK-like adenylate-forming protein